MANKDSGEVMAVIASVLIAFILWTYVMSEKNPIQTKVVENVPVTLTNMEAVEQSNLALISGQDFTVNLTVTGRALDVFNVSPGDFKVEADMSGYLKRGENNIPVEVKSTPRGITVVNKTGYTYIRVKLDALAERSVPVSISIKGTSKEGYGYLSPLLKPSEVLVSGPETYINTIKSAIGQIDISGNFSNVSGSIPVKIQDKYGKPVPYIKVEPKYVDVTIPIKPSKVVPIVVKTVGNAPSDVVIKSIQPRTTSVVVIGDKSDLDRINSIETLTYDLSKLRNGGTRTLSLSIPKGIIIGENIKNINVDFTVENMSEKTIDVPVSLINQDNNFQYTSSDSNVSVKISGVESVVNSVTSNDFTAAIDVKNMSEGAHIVQVKTTSSRNDLNIISANPSKITVTVIKK